MAIDTNTLNKLVKTITSKSSKNNEVIGVYGKVVMSNGKKCVQLDGSSVATPIVEGVEAQIGDIVHVTIQNHQAIVDSNMTAPPSARTASSYIKLTQSGLVLGDVENVNDDTLSGVVSNGLGFHIVSGQELVATFGVEDGAGIIRFFDEKGYIRVMNDILLLYGKGAVGLRSDYDDYGSTYYAEAITKANRGNVQSAIQVRSSADDDSTVYVLVDIDKGISLKTKEGQTARVNGNEILTANTFMITGTAKSTGNTLNAGKGARYKFQLDIPDGYQLAGIREVSSNHSILCKLTEFRTDPSTNQVSAVLVNTSASKNLNDLSIAIEWFAFKIGSVSEQNDINVVTLDPESVEE